MPMSPAFEERLVPNVDQIVGEYGSPTHVYDAQGMIDACNALREALGVEANFFAAKANRNPEVWKLGLRHGGGLDCSSIHELLAARKVGANSEQIMCTSNNTPPELFRLAQVDGGCILNLDDITHVAKAAAMSPNGKLAWACFRLNPGQIRGGGNAIIGEAREQKFGVPRERIAEAYRLAITHGAERVGGHIMVVSNEINEDVIVSNAQSQLEAMGEVAKTLGIRFEFVNIGGGLGIPYKPDQRRLDLAYMGEQLSALLDQFANIHGHRPKLFTESGRYVAGPHGVLITRVLHRMEKYRTFIGVDASMSSLMRPGMYGAYHHITVVRPDGRSWRVVRQNEGPWEVVDVVGGLCEGNDKFAIQRYLPRMYEGDIILIHDTGAHGYAMCFNYNSHLRPAEVMIKHEKTASLIRRAETFDDLDATLNFEPRVLRL